MRKLPFSSFISGMLLATALGAVFK